MGASHARACEAPLAMPSLPPSLVPSPSLSPRGASSCPHVAHAAHVQVEDEFAQLRAAGGVQFVRHTPLGRDSSRRPAPGCSCIRPCEPDNGNVVGVGCAC